MAFLGRLGVAPGARSGGPFVGVFVGLFVGLFVTFAASCFSPREPACAFSCVADRRCPTDYHCGDDGLCHRDDGQGVCTLPPQGDAGDASPDGSATDAGDDAP